MLKFYIIITNKVINHFPFCFLYDVEQNIHVILPTHKISFSTRHKSIPSSADLMNEYGLPISDYERATVLRSIVSRSNIYRDKTYTVDARQKIFF